MSEQLSGSGKLYMLADFVAGVPDVNYDQGQWGSTGHPCGTVGCSMGWGGIGLPQELGFEYDPKRGLFTMLDGTGDQLTDGFTVAERAFGITRDEAIDLFTGTPSTRCNKVAEIRDLAAELAEREKE